MPADSLISALTQSALALNGLPWITHALVAAGGAAGLILWLAGRKVLKPTIVLLFALAGAAAAAILAPRVSLDQTAPEFTWAAAGLVVGAVVGLALFRFAMAVALGAVLGLAAPLGAAVALEVSPAPPGEERLAAAWSAAAPSWTPSPPAADSPVQGNTLDTASPEDPRERQLREVAAIAGEELDAQWDQIPGRSQALLAVSAIGGSMLGVLLGLLVPMWASGAVSALLGPAIWLPCGVWLAGAMEVPGRDLLARSPTEWLIIWGTLALSGLIFQWTGLRRQSRAARPQRA